MVYLNLLSVLLRCGITEDLFYKLQENIGARLLKKYILEDYETFVQRNYSDVVRNIAREEGVLHRSYPWFGCYFTETMIVLVSVCC